MRFTDTEGYFVSEASVYRLLKAHDLIASPAFIMMKAADEFKDKTTAPNQLWQTDFTYLNRLAHVRGAPYHPMTQGKIERWHQTLKNRILPENYFLPGDLEGQIDTTAAITRASII